MRRRKIIDRVNKNKEKSEWATERYTTSEQGQREGFVRSRRNIKQVVGGKERRRRRKKKKKNAENKEKRIMTHIVTTKR